MSMVQALKLSITHHQTRPEPDAKPFQLSSQIWKGGPCIGGTLDVSQRGQINGPVHWCMLNDLTADAPAPIEAEWDLEQINPKDMLSPDGAAFLLVVAMSIAPQIEEEFNDWYETEHIPLLRQVPGVICGRRFKLRQVPHRYAAIYHMTGLEAYAAQPIWHTADTTPWIKRLRRYQIDRHYYMYQPD